MVRVWDYLAVIYRIANVAINLKVKLLYVEYISKNDGMNFKKLSVRNYKLEIINDLDLIESINSKFDIIWMYKLIQQN